MHYFASTTTTERKKITDFPLPYMATCVRNHSRLAWLFSLYKRFFWQKNRKENKNTIINYLWHELKTVDKQYQSYRMKGKG